MQNLSIDADKIGGKHVKNSKGKEFIQIPFDPRYMNTFARKDGTTGIQINLATNDLREPRIKENSKFKDIAVIKPSLMKSVFEKLTDEQKKLIPICGQVSEYVNASPPPEAMSEEEDKSSIEGEEEGDDLPF